MDSLKARRQLMEMERRILVLSEEIQTIEKTFEENRSEETRCLLESKKRKLEHLKKIIVRYR